jgi:hypothetical protein
MTVPAPSPEPMKSSLLGFYVITGVILALFAAGYFAWTPLRLRYAIYSVRQKYGDPYPAVRSGDQLHADEWFTCCLDHACKGNRSAMDAIIDFSGVMVDDGEWELSPGVVLPASACAGYLAAKAQPEIFLQQLSSRSDDRVLHVLPILCRAPLVFNKPPWYMSGNRVNVKAIEAMLQERLSAKDPGDSRLAELTLEFVRDRFAKELATKTKMEYRR